MGSWPASVDNQERTRRLIDLFLVSVLLDAGAGTKWKYKSLENGKIYRRSEGLAVASLEMFKAGIFSSDKDQPFQVDSAALKRLTVITMAKGLQISDDNPIEGLQGRTGLLIRLANALQNTEVFGEKARPGHMLGMLSFPTGEAGTNSMNRLPNVALHDTSFVCSNSPSPNVLGHAHELPRAHLAICAHPDQRTVTRRRMAPQRHAVESRTPLGIHSPFPQIDTMALLLAYGPNDQGSPSALRRRGTDDRTPRIS
jgi:hypothetical protein